MKKPKSSPKTKAAPRGRPATARAEREPAPAVRVSAAERQWRAMYHQLVDFHRLAGHCDVPRTRLHLPLAAWLQTQRDLAAHQRLEPARLQALTELAVDLQPDESGAAAALGDRDERWNTRFVELQAFNQRFGHTRVQARWPENPALGAWLFQQRKQRRNGDLPPDREAKLIAIGLEWELEKFGGLPRAQFLEVHWRQRLADLRAFRKRHGHCQVTPALGADASFVKWVGRIRMDGRDGAISPERRRALDKLGFFWGRSRPGNDNRWARRYEELLAYHKRFGHTRVPASWHENHPLGSWVYQQRLLRRTGRLSPEHQALLERIPFSWEVEEYRGLPRAVHMEVVFQQHLEELKAFKQRFGHCRVSSAWEENPALAKWVQHLRGRQKKGILTAEHRRLLDAAGFVWQPGRVHEDVQWERRYGELVSFHRRFGHTRIPPRWDENPPLFSWHYQQRKLRREGQLPPERLARLEALGFEWEIQSR